MAEVQTASGLWVPDTKVNRIQQATVRDQPTLSGTQIASQYASFAAFLGAVKRIPWVGACASLVAYTFAANPYDLIDEDDEPLEDDEHPLMQLLARPNPWQSGFAFRELFNMQLNLTGNSYLLLQERDGHGRPRELYLPNPARMKVIPDARDKIKGYVYDVSGMGIPGVREIPFAPDEVIHCKLPNPTDEYYGLGVIEMMTQLLDVVSAMSNHELGYWSSGGRIIGALQTDQTLADEEFERVRREWLLANRDTKQRARVAILERGLKYTPMAEGLRSLDITSIDKGKRDQILAIWGVPAQKLGIMENAQYKLDEGDRFFTTETMVPQWERTEDDWQALVDLFDPGLRLQFERRNFEDDTEKISQANQLVGGGLITIDEGRKLLGLEPLASGAGQVILLNAAFTPVRVEDLPELAEQTVAPPPTSAPPTSKPTDEPTAGADDGIVRLADHVPGMKALSDWDAERRQAAAREVRRQAHRARAWRSRDRKSLSDALARPRTRPVERDEGKATPTGIKGRARADHEASVARISRGGRKALDAAFAYLRQMVGGPHFVERVREMVGRPEDVPEAVRQLWPDITPLVSAVGAVHTSGAAAGARFARAVVRQGGKAADDDGEGVLHDHPALRDSLGRRITGIDETMRQDVADEIAIGIDRGYSAVQIADGVAKEGYRGLAGVWGDITDWRAETIARTEAATAYTAGAQIGYREAGVERLGILDGDDDELCASRNDTEVDAEAEVGLAHPNCTVAVYPVIDADAPLDLTPVEE